MPWQKGQSGNKKGRPKGSKSKIFRPIKPMPAKRDSLYIFEMCGYYKIGISSNPAHRLRAIQAGSPFAVNLILAIPLDIDAVMFEKQLHNQYLEKHFRGEWYVIGEKEIKEIKELALSAKNIIVINEQLSFVVQE